MATAILTTDLVLFTASDSTTNWNELRSTSMVKLDDFGPIEGVGSVGPEIGSINLHGAAFDNGSGVDVSNNHVFVWAKTPMSVTTLASGGMRIYMEDSSGNWGEWIVGGSDTYSGGWQMFVVDTTLTPDFNSGSDPTMTDIQHIGFVIDSLGQSGKVQPGMSIDVIRYGSSITVTGGTTGDRLTFQDIADADASTAYGVFRKHNSEGIFLLSGEMNIGDSGGTAELFFEDTNQVVMVADLPVAADFYKINIRSNTTNVTNFFLGTEVGTPPASVGTGGGTIKAVGSILARRPQINSDDADIAGCDFLGLTIIDYDTMVWDQPENRIISCLLSGGTSITLRNSAVLRDSTIDGAVLGVDIGATDPADETFEDLTFQNCTDGILLTPTTDTTYNFRNIKFVSNTTDVRIDGPGTGITVTINVLEGGDTPSVDVTTSPDTVVINNAVTVKVTVKDEAAVPIQDAQVGVFRVSDNSEILNTDSDTNGEAQTSLNFVSDIPVNVRVRKGSAVDSTKYFSVLSPQTISSTGLDLTVTLIQDTINTN